MRREPPRPAHLKKALVQTLEALERRHENAKRAAGVPTGLRALDAAIGGYQRGRVVAFAGVEGGVVSDLLVQLAANAACTAKLPVLLITPCKDAPRVAEQLLAVHAGVPTARLGAGLLGTRDWVDVTKAASDLSEAAIYIDDRRRPSTSDVRDQIRGWRASAGIQEDVVPLVLIEPLAELRRSLNTATELEQFRSLAVESQLCLLFAARVADRVTTRAEWRPTLDDLRPRSLLRVVDALAFVHRAELACGEHTEEIDLGVVELIFAKNDLGPRRSERLRLDPRTHRYTDPVLDEEPQLGA